VGRDQLRHQRPHPDLPGFRRRAAAGRRRVARATHRRDDSGSFLPPYAELEICKMNLFATIDQTGVGN